jgi:hypothetical protein
VTQNARTTESGWFSKVALIITLIICGVGLFTSGCSSGVGQSSNSNQSKIDNVYEICGRLPYADDYSIDLLIRVTREARDLGAGDLEALSAITDSCDQSCVEPTCHIADCNECGIATVDLVYWNNW